MEEAHMVHGAERWTACARRVAHGKLPTRRAFTGDGLGPSFDALARARSRYVALAALDGAFAKFDEYNGGPYATAVRNEQLGELRYWGYLLYYSSNPAGVREEQKEWVR
eukprot:scaffold52590_cov58-Phaeocystis_antarctica.AAC.1